MLNILKEHKVLSNVKIVLLLHRSVPLRDSGSKIPNVTFPILGVVNCIVFW